MPKAADRKILFNLALVCILGLFASWMDAAPPQSAAVAAGPWAHAAELLAARERGETPLFRDLRQLCDTIGGRS